MMNLQELETAIRLRLNLVSTILNDNSYGMNYRKQISLGFDYWGLEFNNPYFVKYAESYGAVVHSAMRAEDLIITFR